MEEEEVEKQNVQDKYTSRIELEDKLVQQKEDKYDITLEMRRLGREREFLDSQAAPTEEYASYQKFKAQKKKEEEDRKKAAEGTNTSSTSTTQPTLS